MPIVDSYTDPDSHLQDGGQRRVTHYFVDHTGGEPTPYGPIKIDGAWGEVEYAVERAALESRVLNKLANNEISDYIEQLSRGVDIFALTPNHQTDIEAFSAVVKYFAQLSIEQLAERHAAIPHLSSLTNPKITSYGLNWTEFNNWLSDADTLKVAINNYIPMVM